jgi:hypothetical protein
VNISPYVYEHINFLNSITKRGPYYMEAYNITCSTAAAIAGRLAAKTGKTVYIHDMLFNENSEFYNMNSKIQPEDFENLNILETLHEK